MKKKVIVAGHICLDITPVFPENQTDAEKKVEKLLVPGRLIQMKGADVHTGGSVANTGLAMKILGADVSLMGKIGTDAFGTMVLDMLKQYQAEEGMLAVPGESTSYSVVLAMPGIDRIFLHNPGANDTFTAEDIPEEALRETSLFHFGYPPLMKKMYQNEGEELQKLFCRVKKAGAATSLDMAAVDPESEAGHVSWDKILERISPFLDFFVPSAEELCYMLDKPRLAEWQRRAGGGDVTEILDLEHDIKPLADRCMEMGVKVLLIKCGASGMYYRTGSRERLWTVTDPLELDLDAWADQEGFERSYIPEAVLSGTGAGDTSIAAFLTAMLEGCGPKECMRLAAATGASCVAAYDALSGLKSFSELRKKIRDGWQKRE